MMLSIACRRDEHDKCEADAWSMGYCECSCHGDEPPAGVREPRNPLPDPEPIKAAVGEK